MRCVIVADDLTGAADASAPLADHGLSVCIAPWSDAAVPALRGLVAGPWDVVVAETDSRESTPEVAAGRVMTVARELAPVLGRAAERGPWVVKKIDSLLRGPVAAELSALGDLVGADGMVIAPALPALGRTTEAGVQCWDGRPVDRPRIDGAGPRLASDAVVARACGHPDATLVPAGGDLPDGGVRVCDVGSQADLDRLAAAIATGPRRPVLVCSSGLLGSLAPHLGSTGTPVQPGAPGGPARTLVVSLSPTAPARRQVAHLRALPGTCTVVLSVAEAAADPDVAGGRLARALAEALAPSSPTSTVLLTVEETGPDATGTLRAAILAAVGDALRAVPLPAKIVLNGGDTTRVLLDARGIASLRVMGRMPHGAAAVRTDDGTDLVLKSGSFGPDPALADLVDAWTTGAVRAPTEG